MCTRILALCGSLRRHSSNMAVLKAAIALAPSGVDITIYPDIDKLPHFSPDLDLDGSLPPVARHLRDQVAASHALVIACPEYMHCLPGSFKNALDWMVGCKRFPGKPVALIQATHRHQYVPALLRDILRTMAADVVEEASVNLTARSNSLDETAILADPALSRPLANALVALASHLDTAPAT